MPPFRVEYLCRYRPLWRWNGREFDRLDLAAREASRILDTGRQVRILDALDRQLWPN